VTGGRLAARPFPASVPVEPGREQARAWAVEELSRPEYRARRPGWFERLLTWLRDQLSAVELPDGPGQAVGLVVLLLVVALAVALLLGRAGRPGRLRADRADGVFEQGVRSAAEHRAAADRAAAAGDLRTAVLERFRAVVRDLEERAVLPELPGRTADEAARAAAAVLPALREDLLRAARVFDDVRYGDRPATAEAERALRQLDDAVRRARPARVEASA
jgi:hypothetical protein